MLAAHLTSLSSYRKLDGGHWQHCILMLCERIACARDWLQWCMSAAHYQSNIAEPSTRTGSREISSNLMDIHRLSTKLFNGKGWNVDRPSVAPPDLITINSSPPKSLYSLHTAADINNTLILRFADVCYLGQIDFRGIVSNEEGEITQLHKGARSPARHIHKNKQTGHKT